MSRRKSAGGGVEPSVGAVAPVPPRGPENGGLGGVRRRGAAPWFPAPRAGARAAYRTSRAAVEEALAGVQLAGLDLVTADLARSVADLVDAARARQEPQLLLSSASRLEQLLEKLPVGRGRVRVAAEDDPSGSVEEVLDEPSRLAELVGRAAAVRDSS